MGNAYARMLEDAEVAGLFEPVPVLQAMLDLERALVLEQAALGMVASAHAVTVSDCCSLEGLQADDLVVRAAEAGSLAIPLVQALRAKVRSRDEQALAAVHVGATSQDLIDSALSVQGLKAMACIDVRLERILRAILRLQQAHGAEPLLARTLMQPAAVTVLEHRLINWAMPLHRCRERLAQCAQEALTLQLSGPVGTAAAWGAKAGALREGVARRMALPLQPFSWQVQRDRLARLAAELGITAGALGKVAIDVALMSQAEVDELQESSAPGRGGSSAMPHKRNPVGAMVALSALQSAPQRVAAVIGSMAQSQERALGPWQAEGAELVELWLIVAGAASAMAQALEGAVVNPQAVRAHVSAFEQAHGAFQKDDGLRAERGRWWAQLAQELTPPTRSEE